MTAWTRSWGKWNKRSSILMSAILHDHAFGGHFRDFDRSNAYISWIVASLAYNPCFSYESLPVSAIINDSTCKCTIDIMNRHHSALFTSTPLLRIFSLRPDCRSFAQTFEFSWGIYMLQYSRCQEFSISLARIFETGLTSFVQIFVMARVIACLEVSCT